MITISNDDLWRQFGAAIDMFGNTLRGCPDHVWGDRVHEREFWYIAYHTLFWLDYYLTDSAEAYTPYGAFGLEELDPAGVLPPRVYAKEELLAYLEYGRNKCRATIAALTSESAAARRVSGWMDFSVLELLLYNMRHVQHHAGQLHLLLRQRTDDAPRWVGYAKDGPARA